MDPLDVGDKEALGRVHGHADIVAVLVRYLLGLKTKILSNGIKLDIFNFYRQESIPDISS